MFLFILFRDALRFHHLLDSRMRSSTIHSCTLSSLSRSETDFGQSSTIRHLQERRNSVQFHLATIFGEYCSCRGIGCLLGGRERIDQQGRGTQGEEECNYVTVSTKLRQAIARIFLCRFRCFTPDVDSFTFHPS